MKTEIWGLVKELGDLKTFFWIWTDQNKMENLLRHVILDDTT